MKKILFIALISVSISTPISSMVTQEKAGSIQKLKEEREAIKKEQKKIYNLSKLEQSLERHSLLVNFISAKIDAGHDISKKRISELKESHELIEKYVNIYATDEVNKTWDEKALKNIGDDLKIFRDCLQISTVLICLLQNIPLSPIK